MTTSNYDLTPVQFTDRGVKVRPPSGEELWLPRNSTHVVWARPVEIGKPNTASIPEWLAKKHRQLVGDEAFDPDNSKPARKPDAGEREYDNAGIIFRNERKAAGSKQPDYIGSAVIDGVERKVAGWIKEGKKGKYLSLSFKVGDDDR